VEEEIMFWDDVAYNRFWSPWQELNRLQDEVNRLFTGVRETQPSAYPAVNIWSNHEDAVITAEIPGMDPASLDVSVLGDTVTLRGKREPVQLKEGEEYHRRERVAGQFARTIQLPFKVDAQKVNAEFKHGILKVHLPRAQEDMPRRITVRPA
jgi:HSP20 family protein